MIRLQTSSELRHATELAERHLPKSLITFSWLKLYPMQQQGGPVTSICYVDQYPYPKIIAGVTLQDSYDQEVFPRFCMFTSYSLDDSKLVEVFLLSLATELYVKRRGCVEGQAIDVEWIPTCAKVFGETLGLDSKVLVSKKSMYWLVEEGRRKLQNEVIEAPIGYRFDTLRPEESEMIDLLWPFRHSGSQKMMEYRIRNFPTICLRTVAERDAEELASFELIDYSIAYMNHLYTMPGFRRRGLASLVEQKQCLELLRLGCVPYKIVAHGNHDGEKITEACPWWQQLHEVQWIKFADEKRKDIYESQVLAG